MTLQTKLIRAVMGILLAFVLATGALTGSSYRAGSPMTASAAENVTPPVEHLQLGVNISGAIRDMLVETDDGLGTERLFVSTDKGLYIFQEKELKRYIPTSSPVTNIATIADVPGTSDGRREVIITLEDDRIANILCYDTANGELLWSQSHIQDVYSDTIGWTYLHAVPRSILVLSESRIACAVAGNLLVLDSQTGRAVAETTLEHPDIALGYIGLAGDINGDGTGDIVGADLDPQYIEGQYHKIYMFNGKNGAPMGAVSVIPRDDGGAAVVLGSAEVLSTNDGTVVAVRALRMSGISIDDIVYLVDLAARDLDGAIDVEGRVTVSAGDMNGDGHDELLNDDGEDLFLYDGASGDILWTAADMNLLEDVSVVTRSGEPAAFGFISDSGTIKMNYINLASGALLEQIDTGLGAAVGNVRRYDSDSLVGYSDEELLLISNAGAIEWDVPVVNGSGIIRGDVTGEEPTIAYPDPVDDIVILSKYRNDRGDESTRVISAIDGITGEVDWSYTIPYALYAEHGGFTWVEIVADLDGDNKSDIAGCIQGSATSIIIEISSIDGTPIDQIDLAYQVYSFDFVPYEPEYSYAVTTETKAAVIDRAGDDLWSSTFAAWGSTVTSGDQAAIRVIDDINDDDIPDLATVIRDRIVISKSQAPWPDYTDEHEITPSSGHEFELKNDIFDYDTDGIDDLVIRDIYQNETSTSIISPASGLTLLTLEYETFFRPSCADFDGDGSDDHIAIQANLTWPTEQSPLRNLLRMDMTVISGADGSAIYQRNLYSLAKDVVVDIRPDSFLMPASPIVDVTGDDIADLAVFVTKKEQTQVGSKLQTVVNSFVSICDLTQSGDDIEVSSFAAFSPTTVSNISWCELIEQIGDVNDNDSDDLALMNGTKMLVVDIDLEHTVTQFNVGRQLQFVDEGDGTELLVSCEGSPYYVDMTSSLTITSPVAGSGVGTPVRLLWENGFADSFSVISADGEVTGRTNDSSYYLSLSKGEHTVGIGSMDRYGKSTYTQATYTMSNGVESVIFAFILIAGAIGAMVALRKLRRMPKLKFLRKGE